MVDGSYVNGKKDAALTVIEINGKYYKNTIMGEHYVVAGEPGEFYLTHVNLYDGRGKSIAAAIYDAIRGTSLDGKFFVIGCDETASMTGAN